MGGPPRIYGSSLMNSEMTAVLEVAMHSKGYMERSAGGFLPNAVGYQDVGGPMEISLPHTYAPALFISPQYPPSVSSSSFNVGTLLDPREEEDLFEDRVDGAMDLEELDLSLLQASIYKNISMCIYMCIYLYCGQFCFLHCLYFYLYRADGAINLYKSLISRFFGRVWAIFGPLHCLYLLRELYLSRLHTRCDQCVVLRCSVLQCVAVCCSMSLYLLLELCLSRPRTFTFTDALSLPLPVSLPLPLPRSCFFRRLWANVFFSVSLSLVYLYLCLSRARALTFTLSASLSLHQASVGGEQKALEALLRRAILSRKMPEVAEELGIRCGHCNTLATHCNTLQRIATH